MTTDKMDRIECLERIITRCNKVIRECDQTLLDIESLGDMHDGDPAWRFLSAERGWWKSTRDSTYSVLEQARKHLGKDHP
jgi:hypothetical protein